MAHVEEGDTEGVPVLQFPVKPQGIAGKEDQGQGNDGQGIPPGAEERNLRRGAAGQTLEFEVAPAFRAMRAIRCRL